MGHGSPPYPGNPFGDETMTDEELRETSVDIAAKLISPASRTVVDTGGLFEIADEIGHYIRTGQHQIPKEA